MVIITRQQWGARAPNPSPFPLTEWASRTGFVVHYSAANKHQTPRQIQNYQMDTRSWRDIGYNFLVDYLGNAYEGCQGTWTAIGAHVANNNTQNIGVCAIGTDADITDPQMNAIRRLYDGACQRANKTLAKRHHGGIAGTATECPGSTLRNWVQKGMPLSTEDVMTSEQMEELKAYIELQSEGAVLQLAHFLNGEVNSTFNPAMKGREWLASATTLRGLKTDLVNEVIEGVLEGLPEGVSLTKADVKQALTEWFTPAIQV